MRRPVAIFFLCVFLLNVAGCYGIFWLLFKHAGISMAQKLDAGDYQKEETVLIKIPVGLPYSVDDTDYKRVDGAFRYKGEFFKLVKQKMQHDTLFIVCIKDRQEKRIFDAMSDFVKVNSDSASSSKTMKLLTSFIKEFQPVASIKLISQNGWSYKQAFIDVQIHCTSRTTDISSPPPEAATTV